MYSDYPYDDTSGPVRQSLWTRLRLSTRGKTKPPAPPVYFSPTLYPSQKPPS